MIIPLCGSWWFSVNLCVTIEKITQSHTEKAQSYTEYF
jgi:hypothetical protein